MRRKCCCAWCTNFRCCLTLLLRRSSSSFMRASKLKEVHINIDSKSVCISPTFDCDFFMLMIDSKTRSNYIRTNDLSKCKNNKNNKEKLTSQSFLFLLLVDFTHFSYLIPSRVVPPSLCEWP